MKPRILRTIAVVSSAVALAGCSSAVTTTSQEHATTDESAIYQPTARKPSECGSSYLYACDKDGYPLLCDPEGDCRTNPAYDAYRYRTFAYGQLPPYNGATTNEDFQPFPGVPVLTLSF